MVSKKLVVIGKVQGVWFRASTRLKARELNILGTVRNLPDRSVEIVAEGDPVQIEKFIEWCHQGPELAKVDRIEITDQDIRGFINFEIIR